MIAAVFGVIQFAPSAGSAGSFWGFFAMFMVLFVGTGVGNASTFRMIPVIFMCERQKEAAGKGSQAEADAIIAGNKEAAAVLGFTSAIAAYGAFFIPKMFGTSIAMTGSAEAALYGFIGFYISCIVISWIFYSRRNAPMPC
jgi:NNP family nitrate/nitrite transporter-like MFS transporter